MLQNSLPDTLQYFHFIFDSSTVIKEYVESLTKCLPKVTDEIVFDCCKMKSSELSLIMKHSHNSKSIFIQYAKIEDDGVFDFNTHIPYNTQFISFGGTGLKYRSNWDKNNKQFELIMKAISESGLKHSLTQINIYQCQIGVEEAQTIANDLDMDHVKLTGSYILPKF